MRRAPLVCVALLLTLGLPARLPAGKLALLVGCTRYPYLEPRFSLEGSENDVVLMRHYLTRGGPGFSADDVEVLTGWQANESTRPTRSNILGSLERLAGRATASDYVVLYLAGHGSQQPDRPRESDPEPDRLDEVFLPADVKGWDGKKIEIENAITDDELGAAIESIRRTGASVWLIVDSCHSGTLMRGGSTEIQRERRIPPDQLLPKEAIPRTRGTAHPGSLVDSSRDSGLVAMYASQPDELTYEVRLPDAKDEFHGLFTFTLLESLNRLRPGASYRDLASSIAARYREQGRFRPTPVIEGADADREILGAIQTQPDGFRLQRPDPEKPWVVDGGFLHGLRNGSILGVYAEADGEEVVIGHLQTLRVGAAESSAAAVAYAGLAPPRPEDVPAGARVRVVFQPYGKLSLDVAVEGASAPPAVTARIDQAFARIARERPGLVRRVASAASADWLLRQEGSDAVLTPAPGHGNTEGENPVSFSVPESAGSTGLAEALARIARAHQLLGLRSTLGNRRDALQVRLELLRFPAEGDGDPSVVTFESHGRVLEPGDRVAFQVTNESRVAVDLTLLFIDAHYRIDAVFPTGNDYNRLDPGDTLRTGTFRVTKDTVGAEQLVGIAVRGAGERTADLSALSQPGLESSVQRGGTRSPLEALLADALDGTGTTRGLPAAQLDDYGVEVLAWTVRPPGR